jgi:hypothetical protein
MKIEVHILFKAAWYLDKCGTSILSERAFLLPNYLGGNECESCV